MLTIPSTDMMMRLPSVSKDQKKTSYEIGSSNRQGTEEKWKHHFAEPTKKRFINITTNGRG